MAEEQTIYRWTLDSPIGELLLTGTDDALYGVYFQSGPHPTSPKKEWVEREQPFRETVRQLKAYFAGKLREFDLPLEPEGTKFQVEVWRTLLTIPYGQTWSYSKLAAKVGRPSAFRAVGAANGQNPIPVIIPCHRVIGADGSLTGFGGGLPIKQKLLALEGAVPQDRQTKLI